MKRYKITGMKRARDYRFAFTILSEYHARNFDYKNDGKEGMLSFSIPKSNALELEKKLKESKLVFKVLE